MNITLTKCNDGLYKVLINDQLLGNGLTFNEAVTLIEEETEEIKI